MIREFLKKFLRTERNINSNVDDQFYRSLPNELYSLLKEEGGSTFLNGLYRVHSFQSSVKWSLMIGAFFEDYSRRILPFGFDWLGRQYCGSTSDSGTLYMFDPSTAEAYELNQSIARLHNEDFVNDTNDMLSYDLFLSFLKYNSSISLEYSQCVGHKIPLNLGGQDDFSNYQIQDMELYWDISNQIWKQIKDLPPGTKISGIKFE